MSFGDVNLSEEQIRGNHNPGAGGWPTVKYFNKDTGYEGAAYVKKTDKAMCDELGDQEMMQAMVEESASTSLCNLEGTGCSEKEVKYIDTWKAKDLADVQTQLTRLDGMKGKSMKPALKKWVGQRLAILKQLSKAGSLKQEL